MATGVLPVFCGGASKAVDLQLNHDKSYRAVLKLGARTDTGDVTGTVLETAPVTAGEGELLAVLPQFIGPQMQVPPMYSAIKLNGQPLYKLAREGVTVERKARPIEICSITYGGSPAENEYVLDVTCSKGTYIRTLLEDIAAAMGQKGTMSALRRTSAGVYTEADAHTLEEILAAKEQGMDALEALMLPVESVFESLPLLVVEPWVEQHLYNGCPTSRYPAADGRYRVRNAAGQFLGLANIVQGVLRVEDTGFSSNCAMGTTITSTPNGAQRVRSSSGLPAALAPKVKFSPQTSARALQSRTMPSTNCSGVRPLISSKSGVR